MKLGTFSVLILLTTNINAVLAATVSRHLPKNVSINSGSPRPGDQHSLSPDSERVLRPRGAIEPHGGAADGKDEEDNGEPEPEPEPEPEEEEGEEAAEHDNRDDNTTSHEEPRKGEERELALSEGLNSIPMDVVESSDPLAIEKWLEEHGYRESLHTYLDQNGLPSTGSFEHDFLGSGARDVEPSRLGRREIGLSDYQCGINIQSIIIGSIKGTLMLIGTVAATKLVVRQLGGVAGVMAVLRKNWKVWKRPTAKILLRHEMARTGSAATSHAKKGGKYGGRHVMKIGKHRGVLAGPGRHRDENVSYLARHSEYSKVELKKIHDEHVRLKRLIRNVGVALVGFILWENVLKHAGNIGFAFRNCKFWPFTLWN